MVRLTVLCCFLIYFFVNNAYSNKNEPIGFRDLFSRADVRNPVVESDTISSVNISPRRPRYISPHFRHCHGSNCYGDNSQEYYDGMSLEDDEIDYPVWNITPGSDDWFVGGGNSDMYHHNGTNSGYDHGGMHHNGTNSKRARKNQRKNTPDILKDLGISVPSIPSIPKIPKIPKFPSIPSIPDIPDIPDILDIPDIVRLLSIADHGGMHHNGSNSGGSGFPVKVYQQAGEDMHHNSSSLHNTLFEKLGPNKTSNSNITIVGIDLNGEGGGGIHNNKTNSGGGGIIYNNVTKSESSKSDSYTSDVTIIGASRKPKIAGRSGKLSRILLPSEFTEYVSKSLLNWLKRNN